MYLSLYNRISEITSLSNLSTYSEYDAYGYLKHLWVDSYDVWELFNYNGKTTTSKLGKSLTSTTKLNSVGLLEHIKIEKGNSALSNFEYSFSSSTGNLNNRSGMLSQSEHFGYDNLNRLRTVKLGGTNQPIEMEITYFNNGNIDNKTDLGSYTYHDLPHAVSNVQNQGGLVSTATQNITYNVLNKVSSITEDIYKLDFTYGPDKQRTKTELKTNNTLTRKTVFAPGYEKITEGGKTRELNYLYAGGRLIAVYETIVNETRKLYYAHTDHLGSIIKLTDSEGIYVFNATYDVWGKQNITTTGTPKTYRGFTGHLHLSEFNLTDMGGRLYDPVLGRFLSPDPYVSNSQSSQDFNRYTYARNNPLSYYDPTGEYVWYIPCINWSKDGGFGVGFSVVVGIPGVYSVQAGLGYNFQNNDLYMYAGASAFFTTVYMSGSTASGFNAGIAVGISPYTGLPVSTNFTSVGINYNQSYSSERSNNNHNISYNASAWSYNQKGGWKFNPTFSVMVFPEHTTNLIKGGGFNSNQQVFENMLALGDRQAILDYFGFDGKYNPNLKSNDYQSESYWGACNLITGNISYGDLAFENFETLLSTFYKESYTQRNVRKGSIAQLPDGFQGFGMDTYLEEINGYIYAYRNQGLYPNSKIPWHGVGYYQMQLKWSFINYPTYSQNSLFNFIYRFPRKW